MKKAFAVITILLLLFLVACESKTTGRRVAIPSTSNQKAPAPQGVTGAVAVEQKEATPAPSTGETAAEALQQLQENPTAASTGPKSGTFYPPITSNATGEQALQEKTDALFKQSSFNLSTDAVGQFGSKYHKSDGDPKNLPDKYSDSEGD